jgi:hypothetical protein
MAVGSGGGGAAGASLVLMLSELTGVYSISSLLLIRRNVPVKYRTVIDTVLGGELEFQYFHRCEVQPSSATATGLLQCSFHADVQASALAFIRNRGQSTMPTNIATVIGNCSQSTTMPVNGGL